MRGGEFAFIDQLRLIALHPAARGLTDDAAVLEVGDARLVLTHDSLVEGVHYLPTDPPADVAWKLLAVNLSDLAAKGARPLAVLIGYALTNDPVWDDAFVAGLGAALAQFNVALIGGDTVALPHGAPRVLGLTAIGSAGVRVPARSGAQVGDDVYVTGTIGDAGQGLRAAYGEIDAPHLLRAYRRPEPQLAAGQALAPFVTAMMDVSDGLLIDAQRLARASGVAISIDLDAVPLSDDFLAVVGGHREARIAAVTAGDDYQLLFTSSLPLPELRCPLTCIGRVEQGAGLVLRDALGPVPLPAKLGWIHG
jgi:thiamine-monophosphate kinase